MRDGNDSIVVLAAYLVGTRNIHNGPGSFTTTSNANGLYWAIDTFLGMSPGLCRTGVQVHIVHDVGNAAATHRGVSLHAFEPEANFPGGDRRWGLYSRVLGLLADRWACAWAVDMDVAAIALPRCGALRSLLHVGSDACSDKIKWWINRASRQTLLNTTWDERFQQFLEDRRRPVYNSGIVGGRRAVFWPALRAVVARLDAHRATQPPLAVGADMLLWNWAAAVWVADAAGSGLGSGVVSGYPHGPVNLPMWAKLPHGANIICPPHWPDGRQCNSPCGYAWLNTSLGNYWFGHKLPRSWLNLLRLHACWPEATSRSSIVNRTLFNLGGRKFVCECAQVGHPPDERSALDL